MIDNHVALIYVYNVYIYIFIFTFKYDTVAQQKTLMISWSDLTFSTEVAGAMSEEGKTLSEIKTQVVPLPKSSFPTMGFFGVIKLATGSLRCQLTWAEQFTLIGN